MALCERRVDHGCRGDRAHVRPGAGMERHRPGCRSSRKRPTGPSRPRSEANRDDQLVTRIGALGYTRAELLDVLSTLGPASVEAYRAQARIFVDLQPQNPAAFDTLLNALASTAPLQPNTTRHLVEQVFLRHVANSDPLPDPYHLPPYRGWPERLIDE